MSIETKSKVYLAGLVLVSIVCVFLAARTGNVPSSVGLIGSAQTTPTYLTDPNTLSSQDSLYVWGTGTGQGLEVAGTSNLIGTVNARGALNVTGAVALGTTTLSGHLNTGGGTPAAPAVGGAGWTAGTLSGNDTKGSVSSTPAAGVAGQITVNFATAFSSAPTCVITPAITGMTTSTAAVFVTSSVSAFSINYVTGVNPVANRWNYICLQ